LTFDLKQQLSLLNAMKRRYATEWADIPLGPEGDGFVLYNNWFGPVDGEMLYAMIRSSRPRRIVEVGSGMSTLCMKLALAKNTTPCELISIDPQPRVDIEGIGITPMRQKVETVGRDVFDRLGRGDVLFIDSSHIFAPGNDIDVLYREILPSLRSGVLVQVHDIFLPNSYPDSWADRGYNEQEHLRQLLDGRSWQVIWAANDVHRRASEELLKAFRSYQPTEYPGSLWMRRS